MFVQEMHFMAQNIAKAARDENYPKLEQLTEDLRIYELRALTLFKDLDLTHIEENLVVNEDKYVDQSPSPASYDEF